MKLEVVAAIPFLDSHCGRQGKVQSMELCLAKQGKAIAWKIWEVATACPKDGKTWLRSLYLAPLPLATDMARQSFLIGTPHTVVVTSDA